MDTAKTQCKTADDKIADLQLQLDRAAETAREQAKKLKENKEDTEAFDMWAEHMKERVDNLLELDRNNRSQLAEAKSAYSKLQAETDQLRSQNTSSDGPYRQQCQQLQSALDAASARLTAAEEKVAKLQHELHVAAETAKSDRLALEERQRQLQEMTISHARVKNELERDRDSFEKTVDAYRT